MESVQGSVRYGLNPGLGPSWFRFMDFVQDLVHRGFRPGANLGVGQRCWVEFSIHFTVSEHTHIPSGTHQQMFVIAKWTSQASPVSIDMLALDV